MDKGGNAAGGPDFVCILLPQEGLPLASSPSHTQVISGEPAPHFSWSVKVSAWYWAVEGKSGTGGLRMVPGRKAEEDGRRSRED